ncbi:hypothetical protein CLV48_104133 [Cecembia rubra]|uniref:Uncharacterized protein n=1 Tax=Cecembia rubra TaxID=1485585 RepID=A0A2P8E680_9BACT|nr:hypothetical protein CLV48_104133 [Cecembia rubra]
MKHLKTFLLMTAFCFSFSIGSSFGHGENGDAVDGFKMESETCSDGSEWKVCRPDPNETCSVSDQTVC